MTSVRKAVFPVAGLGTRFLPATKAIPKEMVPLLDRPTIQWGVEEAVAAGVSEVILVTARGKSAIEDHFDRNAELEALLEARGKKQLLERVRRVGQLARVCSVRQGDPLGLGHAVLAAREAVAGEPFAVLLSDDVISAPTPGLAQLVQVYEQRQASVVCVEEVPEEAVSSYGIVAGEQVEPGLWRLRQLVEKPKPQDAPSRLGIIGRYVLTPRIMELLADQPPGSGGEIQLTDALARLAREEEVYALVLQGQRHDTGTPAGFVRATLALALADPELGPELRQAIRELMA